MRGYFLLRVNSLWVTFFKDALIVVQVGLKAKLALIKFARITCIVFSVRKWGSNKASAAESFCVKHNLAECRDRNCCVFLYF